VFPSEQRKRLKCSVPQVDDVFPGCMAEASVVFSPAGLDAYLDGASTVCGLGRGTELVLIFLEEMPSVARIAGEEILSDVVATVCLLSRTANGSAINPFLSTLPACARRLEEPDLLRDYFGLVARVAERASGGLQPMLRQIDFLLAQIPLGGLRNWIEQGLHGCKSMPHRCADYFSLQSADSRAALQRERHGSLYVDHERRIEQYLRAFWDLELDCHAYSLAFDTRRRPMPYIDSRGFHIPDVYDDRNGVAGIDRYRALLAHLAAHRTYTRPLIADNFSPFQQLAIEVFEDSRIETLAARRYPGLRRLWLALHPVPREGGCPEGWSCIRHRLAMLSRAILDHEHGYSDPLVREYAERFHARMHTEDAYDSRLSSELGVAFLTAIKGPDFRLPKIWFADTEVTYRDDNRWLWVFLEDTEDKDEFHSDHAAANPKALETGEQEFFVRHLREWDHEAQRYRPDWVTVYESIQPPGDPAVIDALLERHARIAKRLRHVVDLLKPQERVRVRYQQDGDELDFDLAVRALVDFRSGSAPDPRIELSHRTDGRDIAVLLLLDLSESIKSVPEGCEESILALSQAAVSLLACAIDALGDRFAVAGFASNTRHEVRYLHFKGFQEAWGSDVKARLAGMGGGYSTRMGAAVRTAGDYLARRENAKKLLLVLTDGEPSDVDVDDHRYLREDTRKAVEEAAAQGVTTYCISLDPSADAYVSGIFGANRYTVIDRVERLPERLPQLFMALTR
jgi:nitric oxide reductase NorD protein